MPLVTQYKRHKQTAGRIIGGCATVITADNSKMHELNETATVAWRLADKGCTAEDVAQALIGDFEVDLQTARQDAQSILNELCSRRILVTVED